MTTAFGLTLVVLGAHYVFRLVGFSVGFARTAERMDEMPRNSAFTPFITVIVAARDEEAVIGRCVDSILTSEYPAHCYEVIVSDDDHY